MTLAGTEVTTKDDEKTCRCVIPFLGKGIVLPYVNPYHLPSVKALSAKDLVSRHPGVTFGSNILFFFYFVLLKRSLTPFKSIMRS